MFNSQLCYPFYEKAGRGTGVVRPRVALPFVLIACRIVSYLMEERALVGRDDVVDFRSRNRTGKRFVPNDTRDSPRLMAKFAKTVQLDFASIFHALPHRGRAHALGSYHTRSTLQMGIETHVDRLHRAVTEV